MIPRNSTSTKTLVYQMFLNLKPREQSEIIHFMSTSHKQTIYEDNLVDPLTKQQIKTNKLHKKHRKNFSVNSGEHNKLKNCKIFNTFLTIVGKKKRMMNTNQLLKKFSMPSGGRQTTRKTIKSKIINLLPGRCQNLMQIRTNKVINLN